MNLSAGSLRETAKIIGNDELTIPRLAEALPVSTESAAAFFEKQIGDNPELANLPEAIARILLAAKPVAQITTPTGPGTGFMIRPGLVMTNNHVLVGPMNERVAVAKDAEGLTITFNYEQGVNGALAPIEQFKSDPSEFFAADRELDFAVFGVNGEPGNKYGVLALPAPGDNPKVGEDVFIIQHPSGGPKQIAMAGNTVEYVDDQLIQYTTDTLPGSSGAPVFDWRWRLAALHHGGGDIVEPASGKTHYRNEGILLTAILDSLDLP